MGKVKAVTAFKGIVGALVCCIPLAWSLPARAEAAPGIDFDLLYQLAQLSNAAYSTETEILGKLSGDNDWVATPGNTHVQYVLLTLEERRAHVIAIRGTVDATNWKLDRDTRMVMDARTGIPLHRGFRAIAVAIHKDIRPHLKRGYEVYLTGHSLGGAAAAVLGLYFKADGHALGGIYTYGQPKFTTAAGARAHADLPLLRVVYQNDAVAFLPDRAHGSGVAYAHIGPVLNLLAGQHYSYLPAEQALRFSQRSLGKALSQVSLPDHRMRWYLKGLRDKLERAREVPISERNRFIFRHRRGLGGQHDNEAVTRYNFSGDD